ncbi:DUF6702 family protein [Pseudotenacibaculum sp. MALMAid0570]|uniref:DUF6702 family protein n=1 Tax=Pseudotenacibaculum sp. MALMAid0570 TaxID=3143938 RepID=UPI0032DFAE21
MKLKKLLIVLSIVPLLAFTAHKYYLSLTQIEYSKESKSLQVIINVFMDDIELALNKDYNIDLRLTTKEELKNSDEYFEKYLKEKLQFKKDSNNLKFNYLGKEYEGDLVYFYLEIENIDNPTSLEVTNKILVKHFSDQQNVVKMKVGKKRRSKILNKSNDKALLKF